MRGQLGVGRIWVERSFYRPLKSPVGRCKIPYVRVKNCVYKQNSDGTKGALRGCSKSESEAKAYLRALYANETKEVSASPSEYNLHGPGGVLSAPGETAPKSKRKKKKVTNGMISPKEFAQEYNLKEKDFAYANGETWVIDSATQALSYLMSVARSEMYQLEATDTNEIVAMMKQLIRFISDQMDEMTQALNETGDGGEYFTAKESSGEKKGSSGHGGYLVTDDSGSHLPTSKNGKRDHGLMGAAWAALHGGYRGNTYQGSDKSAAISKLRKLYTTEGLTPPGDEKEFQSKFFATKEADGKYRWTTFTGSAYEDRDEEIIAEKAFERDCDEMELTGDYGELLWWHCDGATHNKEKEARPYIPLGSCDTSFVYQKINIESGLYYSDSIGKVFNEKAADFGASKSFWYDPEEADSKVFTYIRTKERSLLPRTKEANLLTRLFGQPSKEKAMADNTERIAALKEKLGDDETEKLLQTAKAMSDKADKFLKSKEAKKPATDEEPEDTEEPETDTKPKVKGKEVTLELAIKEYNDKFLLAMKEQNDLFGKQLTELNEKQVKEISDLRTEMAQTQQALGALLGFQPKATNKFVASKEGKVATLTEEQQALADKAKEAGATNDDYLANWLITGERQAA